MENSTLTLDLDTELVALVSLDEHDLQVEELEDRLEMAAGTFCCCCCCGVVV
jgi:hypothetical protein